MRRGLGPEPSGRERRHEHRQGGGEPMGVQKSLPWAWRQMAYERFQSGLTAPPPAGERDTVDLGPGAATPGPLAD